MFKEFWKKYSYVAVKVLVAQLVCGLFGFGLVFILGNYPALVPWASVLSIIFMCFLMYSEIWKEASREKIGVDIGNREYKPLTGLYIGLLANIPNYFIAVLFTVCLKLSHIKIFSTVGGITVFITWLFDGAFQGIIGRSVGGVTLNSLWWVYFLLPVPSLITTTVAYIFGIKGYHFSKLLIEENPEESEIKEDAKQEKKHRKDAEQ